MVKAACAVCGHRAIEAAKGQKEANRHTQENGLC
jgi:hypothetical protein